MPVKGSLCKSFTSLNKKGEGFTLIELLLYISIFGIIILSVSFFLSIILEGRVKNQTMAEVEQEGVRVTQIMTQSIRNSSDINFPIQVNAGSSLSLVMPDGAINPTVFDLNNGVIRVTEGVAPAINLTSSKIIASDLIFSNLSKNSTYGTVKIQFTLTYLNLSGRNEFNYAKTFYASASLRQ